MLGDIVETVRAVLVELGEFMRECGRVRECDLADVSLRLEARIIEPGSPEEVMGVVSGAELLLAPTIDGRRFGSILRWLEDRVRVRFVAGRGVGVALGLESPGIEKALRVMEQVALSLAPLLGPGLRVELYASLNERGLPVWRFIIQLCDDVGYGLEDAVEHGVFAALKLVEALGLDPGTLGQWSIEPVVYASMLPEEPREVCAGISVGL